MSASSEFVALCRSQMDLVIEGLAADAVAIYLSDEGGDQQRPHLVPIVIYPEPDREAGRAVASLPSLTSTANPSTGLVESESTGAESAGSLAAPGQLVWPATDPVINPPNRMVIPLIHEHLVLGLLVVGRQQRSWDSWEQDQLAEVAHTLALACLMDQRHQWLLQSEYEQRSFLLRQYDTLANLLHQIRNPLTTVRTLAKLLFKRQVPGEPGRDLVGSMLQESERLQKLLEQFDQTIDVGEAMLEHPPSPQSPGTVSATTLETTPLALPAAASPVGNTLHLKSCHLREVLQPLLAANQALATDRRQTLTTQLPARLPAILADATALREVLSNLLDNALKYTPRGGQIKLEVVRLGQEHCQVVQVSDTGPGIPAPDLPLLFQRHYRGVQSQGSIPGTGLGLAIARDLMQQMQGRLDVVSPALWRPEGSKTPGSTFIVTLPELKD